MTTEHVMYSNDHYDVVVTDDALGEDGSYGRQGYAAVSKLSGVPEFSSTQFPHVKFWAEMASRQLEQDEVPAELAAAAEDVVLN